jgi:hypothetical protein
MKELKEIYCDSFVLLGRLSYQKGEPVVSRRCLSGCVCRTAERALCYVGGAGSCTEGRSLLCLRHSLQDLEQ